MNQITEGPAWLEFLLCLYVEVSWRKVADLALGLVTIGLVTLALLGTFDAQISLAISNFSR